MQTERDTHTEEDTLIQEETHTPESEINMCSLCIFDYKAKKHQKNIPG